MKLIIGMNDITFLPVMAVCGGRFIYPCTKYTFVHSSAVMVTQTGLMVAMQVHILMVGCGKFVYRYEKSLANVYLYIYIYIYIYMCVCVCVSWTSSDKLVLRYGSMVAPPYSICLTHLTFAIFHPYIYIYVFIYRDICLYEIAKGRWTNKIAYDLANML